MYTEDNDIRTPRDRVSEDDLARYLLPRTQRGGRGTQNDRRESCPFSGNTSRAREGCSHDGNTSRGRDTCPLGDNTSCERDTCPCGGNLSRERDTCSLCGNRRGTNERSVDCDNFFVTLGAPLAAVYSPIQVWKEVYDETHALERGTLFSELDKPFEGRGRKCR